jgi:NAD+ synthase
MKQIQPQETKKELTAFIKKACADAGFSKVVIGLSGGIDSATSFLLAVGALGTSNVFPVLMPYGPLSTQSTIDAMMLIEKSGVPIANITRIDIKQAADALISAGGAVFENVRKGNIMARVRMTVLFDQAKKRQALVLGTENKSEHLLGYFTRYGDEASDIEPLIGLYKTQVIELAKALDVTDTIINKPPSAELWFDQTDEGELGFTYKDADEILSRLYDEKRTDKEIIAAGFDKTLLEKVKNRVDQNTFKGNLPYLVSCAKD